MLRILLGGALLSLFLAECLVVASICVERLVVCAGCDWPKYLSGFRHLVWLQLCEIALD